jgi:CubicO group peptidase (beta-lactamase class C family)
VLEGRAVPAIVMPATAAPGGPAVAKAASAAALVTAPASNTPWVARHGMTSAQYQAEFNTLVGQGYRLVDVSGYDVGGQARYAAIWDKSAGPAWAAVHGLTSDQYQARFNSLVALGFRPVRVHGYTVAGQDYYAAIFEKSAGVAWVARHHLSNAQYQATFTSLTAQGYRLIDVSGYSLGGQDFYTAVFDKSAGPAWVARHGMTSAQYQAEFNALVGQGYRLVDVSGYDVGGQARYAAIWQQLAGPPWAARHGLTAAQYQAEFNNLVGQGYRPLRVSGYTVAGQDYYAAIWENRVFAPSELNAIQADITQFMQQFGVPGASIAIAKDDRLVFNTAFGLADTATGEEVSTNSLFRIASVSKPITSAAIFTLIQQGRLRLTDRVFGPGAILGTKFGHAPYGPNITKITVQNLLEHTAGGWSNDANDPMFTNPGLNQNQLISWVLDHRPLDHVPGTTYAYSNFGYCVLGRVIEQVTGRPYADYVRQAVLAPAGITDMVIAGNTLADRRANEVHYYGQGGEDPYGMRVDRMDSHGGWLATASDLLRFLVRVDGKPGKADILTAASIAQMTTPSQVGSGYAKGWQVNSAGNWWHTGSLPGTATIIVRTQSGFCWTALLNTRSLDPSFFSKLDALMWKVVGEVKTWQSYDLWA